MTMIHRRGTRVLIWFVVAGGMLCCSQSAGKKDTHVSTRSGVRRFDLVSLSKSGAFDGLRQTRVSVKKDPAYGQPKTFKGYPLRAVLDQMGVPWSRVHWYEFVFVAKDGYRSRVPGEKLRDGKPVLAFADVDALPARWLPFRKGKQTKKPAPYYLVWENESYTMTKPWPYQVVSLVVQDRSRHLASEPTHANDAMAGYEVYRTYCERCHSINLVGGDLGPELNVPQSVTTYWNRTHLRGFIQNPAAYRVGSAMPPFQGSPLQLSELMKYLEAMHAKRVCTTQRDCDSLLASR